MSADKYQKQISDALMKNISSDGDLGDMNTQLLSDLTSILQDARSTGTMPQDQANTLIDQMAEMAGIQAQLTQAIEANDGTAMQELAARAREISGCEKTAIEDQPDIFYAIEDGDIDAVKAALQTWEINQRHGKFETTALYATASNMFGFSPEIASFLLDAGADPRAGLTDSNVLHGLGFARYDDVPIGELVAFVRRCVEGGADINQQTGRLHWAPLHYAVTENNLVATEALLIAGADPDICAGTESNACFAGQSSLSMSIAWPKLFELLLNYGADPHAEDVFGQTPAWYMDKNLSNTDSEGDFEECLRQSRAILERHTDES